MQATKSRILTTKVHWSQKSLQFNRGQQIQNLSKDLARSIIMSSMLIQSWRLTSFTFHCILLLLRVIDKIKQINFLPLKRRICCNHIIIDNKNQLKCNIKMSNDKEARKFKQQLTRPLKLSHRIVADHHLSHFGALLKGIIVFTWMNIRRKSIYLNAISRLADHLNHQFIRVYSSLNKI